MADPLIELQAVKKSLMAGPQKLDDIRQNRALLWQALSWSTAQIRLWLRSLPDIQVMEAGTENPGYSIGATQNPGSDLGEIIAQVVAALGKPVAIAQLRTKLPAGTVVTEPMMRTAIQNHPRLTLTGPLVRLKKG